MTAQQAGCTSGVISRTAVDGCSKWPFNALSVKILLDKNIGHRWGIMPMPDANIGGSKMTDTSVNRCIGRALAATRCKLVELLFSAKAFPTKRILGLKWLNE